VLQRPLPNGRESAIGGHKRAQINETVTDNRGQLDSQFRRFALNAKVRGHAVCNLEGLGMSDVFLSYRHVDPDQGLAAQLEQFLGKQQVSTFVDTRIRVGQEWVKAIEDALQRCRYFVVLLSRESILSDMVRKEIALAHRLFRSGQIQRIFPVRVNFDGSFPYDIGSYIDPIQYVLWRDGQDFQGICAAIVAEIRNETKPSLQSAPEPTADELRKLADATELRGAPLPHYDARLETGAVRLNSPFYVSRPTDVRAEQLVAETGETVLVKAPRQFGKTSLLARVVRKARDSGQLACLVDLQRTPEAHWQSLDRFAFFLAQRIARDLKTAVYPAQDRWHPDLGAENLTDFLQDAVLGNSEQPIVVCLDEVDAVFDKPWRRGFFATVRGWHNLRALDERWNNVNLFLAHATDATLWLDDPNQSPFNVGEKLDPPEFTLQNVQRLSHLHNLKLSDVECLDIVDLTGGHPFLVRQALYCASREPYSLVKRNASRDDGPFGDHLRGRLWAVRKKTELVDALRFVLQRGICPDEESFQRLRGAALIRGDNRTAVSVRCRLYRDYFHDHL